MDYLSDLYNAKQLYDTCHNEKANEVILGINVYRFIKNRIKHMNWDAKFDDKGILREVLGLNIKRKTETIIRRNKMNKLK